jgi:hypothetical protein
MGLKLKYPVSGGLAILFTLAFPMLRWFYALCSFALAFHLSQAGWANAAFILTGSGIASLIKQLEFNSNRIWRFTNMIDNLIDSDRYSSVS